MAVRKQERTHLSEKQRNVWLGVYSAACETDFRWFVVDCPDFLSSLLLWRKFLSWGGKLRGELRNIRQQAPVLQSFQRILHHEQPRSESLESLFFFHAGYGKIWKFLNEKKKVCKHFNLR